jgi:hypothetical protein
LAEAEAGVMETSHWRGVWKRRRWCLFDVGENGRLIPASPNTILEQGCACELTEVHLADTTERWWSLGLEAFGAAAGRRDRLLRVARQLLESANVPLLTAADSYGYPAWLQIVAGQKNIPPGSDDYSGGI